MMSDIFSRLQILNNLLTAMLDLHKEDHGIILIADNS